MQPEQFSKVKQAIDCFDQIESILYEPYLSLQTTQCSICLCDYEAQQVLKVLPCFHTYHSECLRGWFGTNNVCPVCRRTFKASELSKLHGLSESELLQRIRGHDATLSTAEYDSRTIKN